MKKENGKKAPSRPPLWVFAGLLAALAGCLLFIGAKTVVAHEENDPGKTGSCKQGNEVGKPSYEVRIDETYKLRAGDTLDYEAMGLEVWVSEFVEGTMNCYSDLMPEEVIAYPSEYLTVSPENGAPVAGDAVTIEVTFTTARYYVDKRTTHTTSFTLPVLGEGEEAPPEETGEESLALAADGVKTEYNAGDALNLEGAQLTYTAQDGQQTLYSFTGGAWQGGAAGDISTSPENGAALDASASEVVFRHQPSGLSESLALTILPAPARPSLTATVATTYNSATFTLTTSTHATVNGYLYRGNLAHSAVTNPAGSYSFTGSRAFHATNVYTGTQFSASNLRPATAYTAFFYCVDSQGNNSAVVRVPFTTGLSPAIPAPTPDPAPEPESIPTPTPGPAPEPSSVPTSVPTPTPGPAPTPPPTSEPQLVDVPNVVGLYYDDAIGTLQSAGFAVDAQGLSPGASPSDHIVASQSDTRAKAGSTITIHLTLVQQPV